MSDSQDFINLVPLATQWHKHIHFLHSDRLGLLPDLQAADGGVDLVFISHRDDVGFEHLVDEEKPVCQLCSCLVEIRRTHQLRAVVTLLAHQANHVNCRRYVGCDTNTSRNVNHLWTSSMSEVFTSECLCDLFVLYTPVKCCWATCCVHGDRGCDGVSFNLMSRAFQSAASCSIFPYTKKHV